MLEEIVDYRDWIGWLVPTWFVAALAIVLRRSPVLGLGLVGAFAGGVLVSAAPPLGGNAEDFGPNLAIGLIGGAAVGALIGFALRPDPSRNAERDRDRSMTVIGTALACGAGGAVLLGFGIALAGGDPPDLDLVAIGAALVGGGLGWVIGALVSWRRTRGSDPPGSGERWILLSAVVPIAILGVALASSVREAAFGPMIDRVGPRHRLLGTLEAFVWIDTAIGIATAVAVALRASARRRHGRAAGAPLHPRA